MASIGTAPSASAVLVDKTGTAIAVLDVQVGKFGVLLLLHASAKTDISGTELTALSFAHPDK